MPPYDGGRKGKVTNNQIEKANQTGVQTIEFNGAAVRMLLRDGEPWFVAKDLVEAVGGKWHHTAIDSVPERHRGSERIPTPGGVQEITILSEAGMNRYLSRSDLTAAQPWQDHICETILPTIRKTGQYFAKALSPTRQLLAIIQAQADLEDKLEAEAAAKSAALEVHDSRLDALESDNAERKSLEEQAIVNMLALPEPSVKAAEKSARSIVNECVRQYAVQNGGGKLHSEAWNKLYREFRIRHHIDARVQAKNRGKIPLDIVEEAGMLQELYAIAIEIFMPGRTS